MRPVLARALSVSLLVLACAIPPAAAGPTSGATLTILGAASLAAVLDEARLAYDNASPGTTLDIATDSSAALETQVEQGAHADVFLSADTVNARKLVDAGLAEGEAVVFARNELTIIVPASNPGEVETWVDLARRGLKIIAAGERVPITTYADQLVATLAARPDAPAGFAGAFGANIVSREDNVKAVVAKLELGEGDAGIVYLTDARASTKVSTVSVPADANVTATYAGVVLKASDDILRAERFLDWFAGPDGQAILARYGFLPPG